jgi:DNA invertase Pin-like site-specific DNA recombinase
MIAAQTKAALQASKARGTRLGRNGAEILAPAYRAEAEERAKAFAPIITECAAKGMSARAIARELEAQKLPTPKGGALHAATVLRIMKRLEAPQ